ncbi:hypothetical protein [Aestuariibaculum marinum]|uniref:Uncharacterized protein n=1 Tax=Aestuariibaculum marinum TaxID=2683592 RepID=A0A8J6U4G7_9FLAO|nr:hypothetical protein [Aestuariibaculum marinum]MBD0824022.1 hypothetical protein [Aestuariibaculum marinum]
MYKEVLKLNGGVPEFYRDKIMGLKKKEKYLKLVEYDSQFNTVWDSFEDKINNFILKGNDVIYTVYNEKTISRKITDFSLNYVLEHPLIIFKKNCDDRYFYGNNKRLGFIKFDLLKGKVKTIYREKKIEGLIELIQDYIVRIYSGQLFVYNKTEFSLLWQKDFSKIAEYQEIDGSIETGEIREVYNYKDTIAVLTQLYVFKIDILTGGIISQQKLPWGFMALSIHKNRAYSCYGFHFIEINLDTLEVINFQRMEYEEHKNKPHFAIMNHPVYHEGLVFHAVRLEGGLHCVGAIDPNTGKRVWIHPIGVYDINSIAFHEDKMFVHDIDGTLHIYEKNKYA